MRFNAVLSAVAVWYRVCDACTRTPEKNTFVRDSTAAPPSPGLFPTVYDGKIHVSFYPVRIYFFKIFFFKVRSLVSSIRVDVVFPSDHFNRKNSKNSVYVYSFFLYLINYIFVLSEKFWFCQNITIVKFNKSHILVYEYQTLVVTVVCEFRNTR